MNIQQLRRLLEDSGVSKGAYILPPEKYPFADSAVALFEMENGAYKVSLFERGEFYNEEIITSEHEACIRLLEKSGLTDHYKAIDDVVKGEAV